MRTEGWKWNGSIWLISFSINLIITSHIAKTNRDLRDGAAWRNIGNDKSRAWPGFTHTASLYLVSSCNLFADYAQAWGACFLGKSCSIMHVMKKNRRCATIWASGSANCRRKKSRFTWKKVWSAELPCTFGADGRVVLKSRWPSARASPWGALLRIRLSVCHLY